MCRQALWAHPLRLHLVVCAPLLCSPASKDKRGFVAMVSGPASQPASPSLTADALPAHALHACIHSLVVVVVMVQLHSRWAPHLSRVILVTCSCDTAGGRFWAVKANLPALRLGAEGELWNRQAGLEGMSSPAIAPPAAAAGGGGVKLVQAEVCCTAPSRAALALPAVSYMPPELLIDDELSFATDAFSFGVVLWELMSGPRTSRWGGAGPGLGCFVCCMPCLCEQLARSVGLHAEGHTVCEDGAAKLAVF